MFFAPNGQMYSSEQKYQDDVIRQQRFQEAKNKQLEATTGVGYDANGRPIAPEWRGIANEDGTLQSQYQLKPWEAVTPDTQALDKFSQSALRDPGQQSEWAKLMMDQQGLNEANSRDQAAKLNQTGLLQMQSNLAQSGGLSGPARERMAKQAFRDGLLNKMQVSRQGQMDRASIGLQDEQSRMQNLGLLQQMQNQQADATAKNQQYGMEVDKFNLGNQFKEVDSRRLWEGLKYDKAMQAWGAGKSADAQAQAARSSGGGGTWICTKVNEVAPLDEATHFGLQALRKHTKKTNPIAYRFYIRHCRDFVDSLNVDWKMWKPWVEHIASLCNDGKLEEALAEYMRVGDELLANYWSDCAHPYWTQRKSKVNQGAR